MIADRYAVLEEIGRGGMGIVWLAEDRTIGRRVAIKELHLPAGVPPKERVVLESRVLREARAAGRLNDPGVVTVHDVLQEDGNTYIVMELIEAPTLSALVSEECPLSPDAVARLAEQLLAALQVAHAAGVIHRDVKPSNIMVLPSGRVKLTDFGIAQSTEDTRLTASGGLVGSPAYIAPEVLHGENADARSDLWALGAVLFFAVEGYSPFERNSAAATMHAILQEPPRLARCEGELGSVITGLLDVSPDARPTATEVSHLLADATKSLPAGGQTDLAHRVRVAPARRSWRLAGSAVVLAVAFVAGLALLRGPNMVAGTAQPLSGDELKHALVVRCGVDVNPDTLLFGPLLKSSNGSWVVIAITPLYDEVVDCSTDGGSGGQTVTELPKNLKARMVSAVSGDGPGTIYFGQVAPDVTRLEAVLPGGQVVDAEVEGGLFAFESSDDALIDVTVRAYDSHNVLVHDGTIPWATT